MCFEGYFFFDFKEYACNLLSNSILYTIDMIYWGTLNSPELYLIFGEKLEKIDLIPVKLPTDFRLSNFWLTIFSFSQTALSNNTYHVKLRQEQGSTDQNRLVQDQAVRSGPRTRPDQDQKFLRNLGPDRTRTKNFEKSRTEPDQDRKILGHLGQTRTRTK